MPSTMRLLRNAALIAAAVYASLWALANLVEPTPRQIRVDLQIDAEK